MNDRASSILVVDDEFSVRDSLYNWFRKDGYEVRAVDGGMKALEVLQRAPCDLALVDIKMPGMDGIELQSRIHEIDPDIIVIVITAYASVDTAVQALKQGAYDYVTKPVDPDELSHLVSRALEQRRVKAENVQLRRTIDELTGMEGLVAHSREMLKIMELVKHVAQTDATVLVRGESGTGKEVIARAIHQASPRRYAPIVPVNCGALPETLLESELFGHEKGAFTGAQYRRKGKLEMADGGTLFLDEIGTITPKTQVDLLRVLETREFTRLGGSRPVKVDFRVICATNEDLEQLVTDGRMRDDLYYRINVFNIAVPPLRERPDDIEPLARHFLRKYALQMDKRITDIEPAALDLLQRHEWPGNVRELANAIERAMVVGTPSAIRAEDLPFGAEAAAVPPAGDSLEEVERLHVKRVLEREGWNITRAAEVLQIDRGTLYNKIRKYGLQR